jgi:hypothetical protein
MITRVLLLFVLTVYPITATAEDPELWERAIALAEKKGFEVYLQTEVMEYFRFSHPDNIEAKELFVPPVWLMAIFKPVGSQKPMILVREYLGDSEPNDRGIYLPKGKAWLINHAGTLEQSCQWDKGETPGPIRDGKELVDFGTFVRHMKLWVDYGGRLPPLRE